VYIKIFLKQAPKCRKNTKKQLKMSWVVRKASKLAAQVLSLSQKSELVFSIISLINLIFRGVFHLDVTVPILCDQVAEDIMFINACQLWHVTFHCRAMTVSCCGSSYSC